MMMDETAYRTCFKGYDITDCVVRSRSIFYFVLVAHDLDLCPPDSEVEEEVSLEDSERQTRVISCFLDKPVDKRWGYVTYKGYERLSAGASQKPLSQFVGVDMEGKVLVIGSGIKEFEDRIPASRQGPRRGVVTRIKTINGFTHASTHYRGLARRDDRNRWHSLCSSLEFQPDPNATSAPYGFEDFDAFDNKNFYCVGGRGDVWHFDGERWRQLEFPSNVSLETVCCGGDSHVYISDTDGAVWKGSNDHWQLIYENDWTLSPFKDMVWFQDRVYATSDHGLYEIIDDEVRDCDVSAEIGICAGNLSVADGVMLLAGRRGAAYHDGDGWKRLFNTTDF